MLKCVPSITTGVFKWRTNESQSYKVAEQAYWVERSEWLTDGEWVVR